MTQNYQGSWPDTGTLQINNTNTPVTGGIYVSAQNPFAANPGNLPAATPFGSSNVNYMVDPRWRNPYSEQFNLGIEKQILPNTILQALTMWARQRIASTLAATTTPAHRAAQTAHTHRSMLG